MVKLVNSDSLGGGDQRYATVSHRWCDKNVPMLKTTKASKNWHYSTGIGKESMPGVLLDAIKVTRTLGLRYLWMDTLCLIQGDDDDKEEEFPKMGAYYANAYFTISASSSADTRESFLQPRDECYEPASFQFGEDEDSFVHVRCWGAEGHLVERGWIWQESALSTRVLNFAPSELIWECKSQFYPNADMRYGTVRP
ncbi:heterokaryon incompatibility protein-domain-containing protein [Bisporella sp. PMI_857]|nr:heterokaryon incompatibility protein-domain-containing protein [Bisporella sp. PMI_857]